jgi:DNA-binding response OmpR family regulator
VSTPKRLLIIEDDRNIALTLEKTFEREKYEVKVARDAESGRKLVGSFKPDLVILDWMLPDQDGLEVLKSIRAQGATPVLFLTARDDVSDKVLGLEMGADDYLTKPFNSRELVARVRSLLRRAQPQEAAPPQLVCGPLIIQVEERRVTRDGATLDLTRTEFDLLLHFVRNPRIVLTREVLLEAVWGYSFEGYQRTVDTHIKRLRGKLERDTENPEFIHTVRGVGYRFEYGVAG